MSNDTGHWFIHYVKRNLLEHFDGCVIDGIKYDSDFEGAQAYAESEAKRLNTPVAVMCQRVIFEPKQT
jgi:hypothetical protein